MNHDVNGKSGSSEADSKIKQTKIDEAKMYLNPFSHAALAIGSLHGSQIDIPTVMKELSNSADRVCNGSTREIEEILMAQASTLNYVFNDALSKLVDLNITNQIQLFIDIAFRAQNQCRKTLTVLAELKNPRRTMFVKQMNNAVVNQQINNAAVSSPEKNENKEKVSNKLLSEVNHAPVDFGRASEAVRDYQTVGAVEKINRTSHKDGERNL